MNIARIAREHTGDVQRAFDELGEAHRQRSRRTRAPSPSSRACSRAPTDPEHRARAGEMLEPVYLRRADWAKVKLALERAPRREPGPGRAPRPAHPPRHAPRGAARGLRRRAGDGRQAPPRGPRRTRASGPSWSASPRSRAPSSASPRSTRPSSTAISADDAVEREAQPAHRRDLRPPRRGRERAPVVPPRPRVRARVARAVLGHRRAPRQGGAARRARRALPRRRSTTATDDDRLDALHTIARLERVELAEPEKAIDTYRAALDVRDTDAEGPRRAHRALRRARPRSRSRRSLPAPRRGGAERRGGRALPPRRSRASCARQARRHRRRHRSARGDRLRGALAQGRHQGARGAHPRRRPQGARGRDPPPALRAAGRLAAAHQAQRGALRPRRGRPREGRRPPRDRPPLGDARRRRAARLRGDRAPPSSSTPRTARPAPSWSGSPRQLGAWEELAAELREGHRRASATT